MSYTVLARKYRPQSFDDLIGQEPVARTLVNALSGGKVAHAYLFSGPRGTGKTTTARLLARALNCEKGPTAQPCGKCRSCTEIAGGSSVDDVLEIDAASNRGIDDIKSLRESVKYAPAHSRFRIYIIDEAHQISKDGFNALLKTLEEPPSYTVFMLATTESQKVPATILSRCQRFTLRPISSSLVTTQLESIAKKEGLKIDRPALEEIVRAAGGSMRDALSLLDQVVVFAPKGAGRDDVREILGFLPREVIRSLMEILRKGDPQAVVLEVARYVEKGGDLSQLARDLQELYHLALQAKAGLEDFPGEEAKELKALAQNFTFAELEKNIRLLGRCMDEMKRSPSPQAIFQVFCLRLSQPGVDVSALLKRVEVLEQQISVKASSPAPIRETPPPAQKGPPPAPPVEEKPPTVSPVQSPPASKPVIKAAPAASSPKTSLPELTEETLKVHWPFIVQELHQTKPSLAASVDDATARVTPEGAIELAFSRSFSLEQVKKKQDILLAALWDRLGRKPTFIFAMGAKPSPGSQTGTNRPASDEVVDEEMDPSKANPSSETFTVEGEASSNDQPSLEEDPWVKKVLGHFQGDLESQDPGSKNT